MRSPWPTSADTDTAAPASRNDGNGKDDMFDQMRISSDRRASIRECKEPPDDRVAHS